jgi:hypothetical protein
MSRLGLGKERRMDSPKILSFSAQSVRTPAGARRQDVYNPVSIVPIRGSIFGPRMDTREARIGRQFSATSHITGAAFDLPEAFGLSPIA